MGWETGALRKEEAAEDTAPPQGLVATAEESSKISVIKALKMKLGDTWNGRILRLFDPFPFWALLHGYNS